MVNIAEKTSMGQGSITSPEQKFMADLARSYDAEKRLLESLKPAQSQAQNEQLKSLLQMGSQQAQENIQCLEQIFSMMGKQPERLACQATVGLINDRQTCLEEINNNAPLCDGAIAYGQLTALYAGIASYSALIIAAVQKGQKEVINMLMKNAGQIRKAVAGYELCLLELSKQATG
jgi:ferritin-like metal-binding protein YciE